MPGCTALNPNLHRQDTKFRSFQGTILLPHHVLAHPYCPKEIRKGLLSCKKKHKKQMKPKGYIIFLSKYMYCRRTIWSEPVLLSDYLLFSFLAYHKFLHFIPCLNLFTFSTQSLVLYWLTVYLNKSPELLWLLILSTSVFGSLSQCALRPPLSHMQGHKR